MDMVAYYLIDRVAVFCLGFMRALPDARLQADQKAIVDANEQREMSSGLTPKSIFGVVVSKGVSQPLLSRYIYQDTFFFKRNICRFHRSEVSNFKGSVKPADELFTYKTKNGGFKTSNIRRRVDTRIGA